MARFNAAITGIGMSRVSRGEPRPAMAHLADAALEAIADAGLDRADIDGLVTYPGRSNTSAGFSPLGTLEAGNALGLKTRWHAALPEGAAQAAPLIEAAMVVTCGMARHVLCFRALTEYTSGKQAGSLVADGGKSRVGGWFSWYLPMNAVSATNWAGWLATRYMHEFGLTREHLGKVAVDQRRAALLNDRALMKKPLTMDEYMNARLISSPLCLFDCDVPIDGACAIIVSAADAAKDTRKTPLRIESAGAAVFGRESWDQRDDLTTMGAHDVARDMWAHSDFRPDDIDVLSLYDGFSIFVPYWLEAFGFCGHGEAPGFIEEGHAALEGRFPVNTGGGQLSSGRLHGFGLLHEACVQLWGEAGARQVKDARRAVCGMGGGPLAGSMLISRD